MALAAILSAMRTIILDSPYLPESESARRSSYRGLFPSLSNAEIEDLAKISPQRFRIYTRSIFSGESDLITHYHQFTHELLQHAWQEKRGEKLVFRDLVRAMHAQYAWSTKKTEGLIENFAAFLKDISEDLEEYQGPLIDAAQFERHIFYARRCLNSASLTVSISRAELAALTVGEALSLHWSLPSTSSLQEFSYDIATAFDYFRDNNLQLIQTIPARRNFMIFGRDPNNVVRRREIPEPVFQLLTGKKNSQGTLDEIAEAFIETLSPEISETESFARFIEFVLELSEAGLITVAASGKNAVLELP